MDINESKTCVFCGENSRQDRKRKSCDTYEAHQNKSVPKMLHKVAKKHGSLIRRTIYDEIKCSVCGMFSCVKCITAVCAKLEESNSHHNDRWYQEVKHVLQGKHPSDFVGHCCEIQQSVSELIAEENALAAINSKDIYLDGYLHLPQLHILLPPPLHNFIDVHGFGEEDSIDLPGLIHGVVDYKTAKYCFINDE